MEAKGCLLTFRNAWDGGASLEAELVAAGAQEGSDDKSFGARQSRLQDDAGWLEGEAGETAGSAAARRRALAGTWDRR